MTQPLPDPLPEMEGFGWTALSGYSVHWADGRIDRINDREQLLIEAAYKLGAKREGTPGTLAEVYRWWCGVQGVEPYSDNERHKFVDGHYDDAVLIWRRFCDDEDADRTGFTSPLGDHR